MLTTYVLPNKTAFRENLVHRKLITPDSYPDLHVEPFPVEVVDDLHPEQVCAGRAAPAGLRRWICHDFRENEDVGG